MSRSFALARLMGQTALVAALVAELLPLPVLAQETTVLETITVEGQADATGPVGEATNPATSTGSKMAAKLTEIPQSVSVIGSDALAAANTPKIDAALSYSAGVQAQPYGYDSDTNWFFVRGFSATSTGAFVDGLPSYSYGFGGFYIDPAGVERIEVLRGPASALYGASNPGGIVNMVSKRPTGTEGGTDTAGADSAGRVWAETDRQGVLANGIAWRFIGKAERTDDMGAFDPGKRFYLAPSMTYTTDGGTELTFGATYTTIDEDHVGGSWLPYIGTVKAAEYGFIDREFNTSEPAVDWYKRDQLTLSAEIAHGFDNGWRLVNNARIGRSKIDESAVYAYGYQGFSATPTDPAFTLSRIFFQHRTETETALNDLRLEREFATGAVDHRLMFGVDAKWFRMDQVQSAVAWPASATGLSVTHPNYGAAQPATTPYLDNVVTQTQLGLYAQDQMRWGDGWIATLNLRHDSVETDVSDDRSSGAAGSLRRDGATTWRLGLAKEFANGLTAYASAATYFNPQVETSAAGSGISPETGRQIEAGLKFAPSDDTMLTLSLFDIDREGIVQSVWNGAGYDFFQLGKVNSRGIELEARHDFNNGIVVSASATTMDVRIKDDVNPALIGKTPYVTIEDMAAIKLEYTPAGMDALTLTGGLRYLGASWADNANTLKVPSVTLVDAGAGYRFATDWAADIAITNLTDETYVASCQNATGCYYGEGRRISVSLSHRF